MAILLRILTNYSQIISSSIGFSFSYPSFLVKTIEPISSLGQSQEMLVSYDCLLKETRINIFAESDFIFKIFVSCFTPFVFVVISLAVFSLLKVLLRK